MPATPIYALPYPAASDPADVPLDLQELAERIALVLGGALSPTPPASPFEGQLWSMSPVAGVVWTFRYNPGSASAFKWEFVGGPSLGSGADTPTGGFGGTTFADPTTIPLAQVTVPRAGEYEIVFSATLNSGAGDVSLVVAPKLGAAPAADLDRAFVWTPNANGRFTTVSRVLHSKTLAAGDLIKLQYKMGTAGTGSVYGHSLIVRPIRVS